MAFPVTGAGREREIGAVMLKSESGETLRAYLDALSANIRDKTK